MTCLIVIHLSVLLYYEMLLYVTVFLLFCCMCTGWNGAGFGAGLEALMFADLFFEQHVYSPHVYLVYYHTLAASSNVCVPQVNRTNSEIPSCITSSQLLQNKSFYSEFCFWTGYTFLGERKDRACTP